MYHKSTKCISTAFVGKNGTAGVAMRVPEGYPGHSAASAPGDAAPHCSVWASLPRHTHVFRTVSGVHWLLSFIFQGLSFRQKRSTDR